MREPCPVWRRLWGAAYGGGGAAGRCWQCWARGGRLRDGQYWGRVQQNRSSSLFAASARARELSARRGVLRLASVQESCRESTWVGRCVQREGVGKQRAFRWSKVATVRHSHSAEQRRAQKSRVVVYRGSVFRQMHWGPSFFWATAGRRLRLLTLQTGLRHLMPMTLPPPAMPLRCPDRHRARIGSRCHLLAQSRCWSLFADLFAARTPMP